MEDILTFNNNIDSYKDSIINTLNLDSSILEDRINEELFNTYIELYLKDKIKNSKEIDNLFDQIIVKFAKNEKVFNKYISPLLKLKHKEYIDKIKEILDKDGYEIARNYINNDDFDYSNEIENYILTIYVKNILKNELKTIKEQTFFINYLININASDSKLDYKVIGLYPSNNNYRLFKNSKYTRIDYINYDYILINLTRFNYLKRTVDFKTALTYLINSCLNKLVKKLENNMTSSYTYDENTYRFIKENIIYMYDTDFYSSNKEYFAKDIYIKKNTNKMLLNLLDNPLFKDLDFLKDIESINTNDIKNTKDYNELEDYIDTILIKHPDIIRDNSILEIEYNLDGTKKTLPELINIRINKVNTLSNQIISLKTLYRETSDKKRKKEIETKLDNLTNNIIGIRRCHNKIIYKSLKNINVSMLERMITKYNKKEIDILEEVIEQEKNDFIKKLENNRKKIFKPSTFLKNEQFLTKEYALAARYESKLRDIRKEKEI